MATTVGMISLGCAKNRVDSEQMLGLLRGWGYTLVNDPAQAEILIVNTCGFIASAKEESIDTIFEMAAYKRTGCCRLLVVTGCLVQRYGDALKSDMPEIDVLLGVASYPRLQQALQAADRGERPMFCAQTAGVFEAPRVLTTPPYSAYVRTGEGCDNRCAYCAIPLIRGPYRSRRFESVLEEAHLLSEQGAKEIVYIAQDTTRFGDDIPPHRSLLADLIARTCEMPKVEWVRALYCYPSRVNEQLLETIATQKKACKYLDLPLQHIDAALLQAMNRTGTPEQIRRLIARVRQLGFTLRTTFIVGFPGETEDAFERLMDFVEETRFERMGAFAYSPEEDTKAIEMPNQVPEEVKAERLDRLMRLQQRISLGQNEKRIGSVCKVLVEQVGKEEDTGRSEAEAPETDGSIRFHALTPHQPGDFVQVRIQRAWPYDLEGIEER